MLTPEGSMADPCMRVACAAQACPWPLWSLGSTLTSAKAAYHQGGSTMHMPEGGFVPYLQSPVDTEKTASAYSKSSDRATLAVLHTFCTQIVWPGSNTA